MIILNGTLCDYCKDCPYMELIEIAQTMDGKIYDCANSGLCSRLWHILKNKTTEGDPK